MDPLARRVADRYLMAIAIGDPHDLVHKFDTYVNKMGELEHLLPKMREAQKYVIETPNAEWANLKKLIENPVVAEHVRFYFEHIKDFRYKVNTAFETLTKYMGAASLFLAILQQYELAPATRKLIENAAKFFSKTRTMRVKDLEALDAYDKAFKLYQGMSLAAHDAIAHGKLRSGGGGEPTEKTKAGPFTIVNTGGFDEKVIAECAKVVETSAHLLQGHGMGQVCYGDVLISNTLSKKTVLAFYLVDKDEMFVRANLNGHEHDAVRTVCHELGHRLYFKFLSGKKREIAGFYYNISHKESAARSQAVNKIFQDPSLKPKPGDVFIDKGTEYVVTKLDFNRAGWVVEMADKTNPRQGARISLEGYAVKKGILPQDGTIPSGFVTAYAKTNAEENFAEMVAYYCMGKLPADQVEMLKSVL